MYVDDGWEESAQEYDTNECLSVFLEVFLFQARGDGALEGFWNFRTQSSSFK